MDSNTLTLEFLDEEWTVSTDSTATFGRAADIVLDTNPALHRVVGLFFYAEDSWWLTNRATSSALTVSDDDSASTLTIAPGATARLSFPSSTISFQVGEANYRLSLHIDIAAPEPPPPDPTLSGSGNDTTNTEHDGRREYTDPTAQPETLPLTPEQLLLVVALAEPSLRAGAPRELPTNREVASRLGWQITKFNRKLDSVCKKLADGGVSGLVGTQDRLARDRRLRLVEYATYAGLISEDDLKLLDIYQPQAGGSSS